MLKTRAIGKKLVFILPALLFIGLFLTTASLPVATYANSANVSCGKPTAAGTVTVAVVVKHADGTKRTVKWSAAISATDDANQKAAKIRAAAPAADPDITVGGTLNVVSATTKNAGDKITAMGFASDSTHQKETHNVFAVAGGNIGAFSDAGVAAGDGYVEITYKGYTATVYPSVGQTAGQIEDALVTLFKANGVNAYVSTTNPVPGVTTDGRYVYFCEPSTTDMDVEVTDTGITNDLAVLLDPAEIPTLSEWAMIILLLVLVGLSLVVIQRRRRLALRG